MTAVGADGNGQKLLASTVMNSGEARDDVLLGSVVFAVIVPEVKVNRTFCVAGGAFWCGFHKDGSNHASNVVFAPPPLKYGLKISFVRYGRFLIPAISYGCVGTDGSIPNPINIGILPESH